MVPWCVAAYSTVQISENAPNMIPDLAAGLFYALAMPGITLNFDFLVANLYVNWLVFHLGVAVHCNSQLL